MKKKYLKKDIYLQKKDKMLLIIFNINYNSIVMEYQKIIKLLDNTPNQPNKFRTKTWIEINDELRGTYNTNSQIKFKTSMLRSSLCDYGDAYIVVSRTITVEALAAGGGNNDIQVVFKNCATFTNRISEINNAQIDSSKTSM